MHFFSIMLFILIGLIIYYKAYRFGYKEGYLWGCVDEVRESSNPACSLYWSVKIEQMRKRRDKNIENLEVY
jgi:hypothetical protein